MCMFIPGSKFCFYEPDELDPMIRAVGVEKTILGSDLGQTGNPTPVEGFRHVIGTCLELGYSPEEIRSMVSTNACALVGIEPRAG
jgi:microsomal dipeptidase-like Zn-dependent dipeptidase